MYKYIVQLYINNIYLVFFLCFRRNRKIRADLKVDVVAAQNKLPGSAPGLAIVQVGGRDDSNVYIRMKIRAAAEIGIVAEHVKLPKTATEHELLSKVSTARWTQLLHGQCPLDIEQQ